MANLSRRELLMYAGAVGTTSAVVVSQQGQDAQQVVLPGGGGGGGIGGFGGGGGGGSGINPVESGEKITIDSDEKHVLDQAWEIFGTAVLKGTIDTDTIEMKDGGTLKMQGGTFV